jgi:photosystem II stability/assembly factor-like uncharacterized protein
MKKSTVKIALVCFISAGSLWGQIPRSIFPDRKPSASYHSLPPSNSASHIAVDGSNIYIGTGHGLALSTDIGYSWTSFADDPAFSNGGIYAIAVRNGIVWVSTGYDKETNAGSVQTGSGYTFLVHPDSQWHHVEQTLDVQGDSIITYGINDSVRILPVIVPEQNITFDIALSDSAVWIASWASGLRKTTDNGQTWQRFLLPLDDMNSLSPNDTLWTYSSSDTLKLKKIFMEWDVRDHLNLLAFAVHVSGNDTIWCGTAGGINKSTDGGLSWTKFSRQNQSSPILGNWVITIREQSLNGFNRLWTTNWKTDNDEEYGVSYTDDGGKTWINLLQGIKAYDFAFKDSIAYIATSEGFYRTADGGQTFTIFTNAATALDEEYTTNNSITLYDPATYQAITTSEFFAVGVAGNEIIVGTGDGLATSHESGDQPFGSSWKVLRTYEQLGDARRTYAYPNPFSPRYELVRIHYGALSQGNTGDTRKVTIDIFDFGMNRVKTLLKDAERGGTQEYDELWDGRDDNGRLVANGVYFYRVVFNDSDPMMGKILVLQ